VLIGAVQVVQVFGPSCSGTVAELATEGEVTNAAMPAATVLANHSQ
jgi:hypothetical protein